MSSSETGNNVLVVGVAGGTASGKTTIAKRLQDNCLKT